MWNFRDAVRQAAKKADIPQTRARKFLDALFDSMEEALSSGEPVRITKWFVLKPVVRGKRRARNPRTNEAILINDRIRVKFKPLKRIKDIQAKMTAHLDARKAAETYVSELFLYYADKIDEWIRSGVMGEFMEQKLADAREAYSKRVPQWVREEFDYFEDLLKKMIEERKKRLGLA